MKENKWQGEETNTEEKKESLKQKWRRCRACVDNSSAVLRRSVVTVMLPSGLRLVPATSANWQTDIFFSPSSLFDWQPQHPQPLLRKFPINTLEQHRSDGSRCSYSTNQTLLLKGDLPAAAGKNRSFIFSFQGDRRGKWELLFQSFLSKCCLCAPDRRPLRSTLLFLFLTPYWRQSADDEKLLWTSGW